MVDVHLAGFDPGLTGGAAVIRCASGAPPRIVRSHSFGTITAIGKRKLIDARALYAWLLEPPHIDVAVIEQVNAMPKQGVSSTFTFGAATGALEALVMAAHIPTVEWVRPTKWKGALHLGKQKHAALDKASLLYGQAAATQHWPRKADGGIAEAALVALWYARHQLRYEDAR